MEVLGDYFTTKEFKIDKLLEDNFILNLEFPITNAKNKKEDKICLKGEDSKFNCFHNLPTAVTLANNHIFDYGIRGVEDTLDYLKKNEIFYFGLGNEDNNFNQPFQFDKLHFYNYCSLDTNPIIGEKNLKISLIDENRMIRDITTSIRKGFKPVLIIHWGEEESIYPAPKDILLAKRLISYGAYLILGHHAHVIQSKIRFGGHLIYFGLGNFIFDDISTRIKGINNTYLRYEKKQKLKNRRSLGIVVQEKKIKEKYYQFNQNEISQIRLKVPTKTLSIKSYKTYLKFMNRKIKILNFLKNPRNISLEKLKRF